MTYENIIKVELEKSITVNEMDPQKTSHLVNCLYELFNNYSDHYMICYELKLKFDEKYGRAWSCFIGKEFSYKISHKPGCYAIVDLENDYLRTAAPPVGLEDNGSNGCASPPSSRGRGRGSLPAGPAQGLTRPAPKAHDNEDWGDDNEDERRQPAPARRPAAPTPAAARGPAPKSQDDNDDWDNDNDVTTAKPFRQPPAPSRTSQESRNSNIDEQDRPVSRPLQTKDLSHYTQPTNRGGHFGAKNRPQESSLEPQESGWGASRGGAARGGRGGGRSGWGESASLDDGSAENRFDSGRGGFSGRGGRGGRAGGSGWEDVPEPSMNEFGDRQGWRSGRGARCGGFSGGRGGGGSSDRGGNFRGQGGGNFGGHSDGGGRGGWNNGSGYERDQQQRPAFACYNCGDEGHRSSDCTHTRKRVPARFDPTEEPINRNHVPESKEVEELYKEDKTCEEHYRTVADEDEDITVTPDDKVMKIDTWQEAQFEEVLYDNVQNRSVYTRPRKIQCFAIPLIMDGNDLVGHAETGAGKTATFLLPIINKVVKLKAEMKAAGRPISPCTPFAIIVAPTRELVLQIYEQGLKFSDRTDVKFAKAYGLYNVSQNINELHKGCDVLCAAPGRLKAFVKKVDIIVKNVHFLVLDEADRLMEERFMEELDAIVGTTGFTPKENRQTLLFSATFTDAIQDLARKFLRDDFVLVSNKKRVAANSKVQQNFMEVCQQEKNEQLREMLMAELEEQKRTNPVDPKLRRTLVFVKEKRQTKLLSLFLTSAGLQATIINGDMSQDLRERALKAFRDYTCPVLIATDVCARGIDIKDLDHVVNFDLPEDPATYVHRIGRTGRIKEGTSTSFFDPRMDTRIVSDLIKFVRDASQEPPEWFVAFEVTQKNLNLGFGNVEDFDDPKSDHVPENVADESQDSGKGTNEATPEDGTTPEPTHEIEHAQESQEGTPKSESAGNSSYEIVDQLRDKCEISESTAGCAPEPTPEPTQEAPVSVAEANDDWD